MTKLREIQKSKLSNSLTSWAFQKKLVTFYFWISLRTSYYVCRYPYHRWTVSDNTYFSGSWSYTTEHEFGIAEMKKHPLTQLRVPGLSYHKRISVLGQRTQFFVIKINDKKERRFDRLKGHFQVQVQVVLKVDSAIHCRGKFTVQRIAQLVFVILFLWLFNKYSSSPNGLWVNSSWGQRQNGLLTQRPWGREKQLF